MFSTLDRKSKLYQRKDDFHGIQRQGAARFLDSKTEFASARLPSAEKAPSPTKLAPRELTEQTLLQVAPSSALVNEQGDILYLHGRTGMFLEPAPGVAGVSNILKMAREGLRPGLTAALSKAAQTKKFVRCAGLRVKTNGHFSMVDLGIHPVASESSAAPESRLYVVMLEEKPQVDSEEKQQAAGPIDAESEAPKSSSDARIAALKQELQARDEYIQSAREELETTTEELKSSNEEMQSVNEELQSTNEELETSKEELQSVNEELATVNTELQTKVVDLSRANNDMNNLLAGTGIGTVFVDHQLRILRFTPAASAIINLIMSDVGRPVGHLVSNLVGYDRLVADVQDVLNTLVSKEVPVQTKEREWYMMRIQPYRTLDNVIEGAVISFVNITETVQIRDALHKSNELMRLAVVVRDAHDAITVQDLDGRILAWNPGAVRMYGWSEAEALLMNVRDRIPAALRAEALDKVHQLGQAEILEPYCTQRIAKGGATVDISMVATALLNETGEMYAIATTERARA